jgi:hypothetical protein
VPVRARLGNGPARSHKGRPAIAAGRPSTTRDEGAP